MRLLFSILLSLLVATHAAAEEPRVLPPLLSRGALCGPIVPCARSGDVAAHLRWTIPIWDLGLHLKPAVQFSMSASLFSWAELGAAWYGELVLAPTAFLQGPITLWVRLSPPPLSALFSDYPKEGLFLAAQVEHASGSTPFNLGAQLAPDAQTFTAIAEWRKGRVMATAAAGVQIAGAATYRGLDAGGALWLLVQRSTGLQLGAEVRGRIGAWPEDAGALRTGWVASLNLAAMDGEGFEGGLGALVRAEPGGPRPGLLAHGGWSVGPAYRRPVGDRALPPLLDELQAWLAERWARRGTQVAAPYLKEPDAVPESLARACSLPGPMLPPQILRSCVVAGPPVRWWSYRPAKVAGWREDARWVIYQAGHAAIYGTTGLACGVVEGVVPLFRCYDPRDPVFRLGQGIGQAGIGVAQMVVGGGGAALGMGLDLSGIGAPVGVLVGAASTGLIANGAYAVRGGTQRLAEAAIYAMTAHQQAGQRPAPAVGSSAVSKSGGAAAGGKVRTKDPPNPHGSPGKPDHQETVRQLQDRAALEFPDRGSYKIRVNESIRPETGINRRPDVSVFDKVERRIVKVYEAARANKDGVTPVARERKKVLEYEGKRIPAHVEIVK